MNAVSPMPVTTAATATATNADRRPTAGAALVAALTTSMITDPIPGYVGIRGATAYNEAAFRWFLAADRVRARRLQRCLFLVLVAIRQHTGRNVRLPQGVSQAVFRGLGASVREVDLVGWFREEHVAAALLVQGPQPPDPSAATLIATRVTPAVASQLPATLARDLRVRVVRLGHAFRE
jgi:hypothetical protein